MTSLKNNKLYLGDCQELLPHIADKSIDLIITDPPYEIKINGGGTVNTIKKLSKSLNEGIGNAGLTKGFDYESIFKEWDRVLKNINLYVFCNKKQIPIYFKHYVYDLKCTFDIIVWNKNNALPTYYNKYLTDCEYILHFRKNAKCKPESYEDAKTVFLGSINHKDKKEFKHPTIKPVELVEKFVRNSSSVGDTILDPFAGSGTTAIACLKNKRNCILMEKDTSIYEIASKRITDYVKGIK